MIIFMCGYPGAGKSQVARQIAEQLPYIATIIDPKELRTDNYDEMDEVTKREVNLSVWEVSLDLLAEQIKGTADDNIIIYDTACANLQRMKPLFEQARTAGHHVLYIFVVSPLEKCQERMGDKWLAEDVVNRYTKNFKENINAFKALADKTIVVRNGTDESPDLSEAVEYITKHYG